MGRVFRNRTFIKKKRFYLILTNNNNVYRLFMYFKLSKIPNSIKSPSFKLKTQWLCLILVLLNTMIYRPKCCQVSCKILKFSWKSWWNQKSAEIFVVEICFSEDCCIVKETWIIDREEISQFWKLSFDEY